MLEEERKEGFGSGPLGSGCEDRGGRILCTVGTYAMVMNALDDLGLDSSTPVLFMSFSPWRSIRVEQKW